MNEVSCCSYQDPLLQHSKNNYTKSLYNVVISIWNWQTIFFTEISLNWQIIIERLNVYITIVANVPTYVPCKMKQKSTKYVYKFFLCEFITPDSQKVWLQYYLAKTCCTCKTIAPLADNYWAVECLHDQCYKCSHISTLQNETRINKICLQLFFWWICFRRQ